MLGALRTPAEGSCAFLQGPWHKAQWCVWSRALHLTLSLIQISRLLRMEHAVCLGIILLSGHSR